MVIVKLTVILTLIVAVVFTSRAFHTITIDGYKDDDLVIYDCWPPIEAKEGIIINLIFGPEKGLVPADMDQAKRYCRATGIE